VQPRQLDHLALWVPDRQAMTQRLLEELSVRIIDETERHTLIGPNAHAGKLTLFDAPNDEPPAATRLLSVLLADPAHTGREPLLLDGGLTITFGMHAHVEADVPEHALIGLSLRSADPTVVAAQYAASYGFEPVAAHRDVASVRVGNGVLTLVREDAPASTSPMLNHLGLLVSSADEHLRGAQDAGIEVLNVVDAPNTIAVFVDGPEHVSIEYVEHKPEFALA
jgi:hypothetical protein